MGTPAFPGLGRHCAAAACRLVDFLPFTCNRCREVYCLEHRSYAAHECPQAAAGDAAVLLCPLCARAVRLVPSEDPNVTWDRHVAAGCDPSNYARATKKPRCPAAGCKEPLTFSNTVRCKACSMDVCLRHRFGEDHGCPKLRKGPAAPPAQSLSERFLQSFRDGASLVSESISSAPKAAGKSSAGKDARSTVASSRVTTGAAKAAGGRKPAASSTPDPANTVRGSVHRRQDVNGNLRQPPEAKAAEQTVRSGSAAAEDGFSSWASGMRSAKESLSSFVRALGGAAAQGGTVAAEECPRCHTHFPTADELIRHVDVAHTREQSSNANLSPMQGSNARASKDSGQSNRAQLLEVCPQCGTRFADAVALVAHTRQVHNI
eukprot:SM000060S19599  [mRNA]  locus=s60:79154:81243:- [translate_table: standard]